MDLNQLYGYGSIHNTINATYLSFYGLPEYQEITDMFYNVSDLSREVKYAERLEVHACGETDDISFLLTRHPSEDDSCYSWRKANFKAVTYQAWQRAVSFSQQVVSDSNWSYTASEELKSFLNYYTFDNYNLFAYLNTKVFPFVLSNPNGVTVLLPFYTPDGIIYDMELVEEEDIRYIDENEGLIIYKTDKETVQLNNGEMGIVFYLVNNNYFCKAAQYGDKKDNTFNVTPIYLHELDTPFFVINGGTFDDDMYKSFFDKFTCFGDEALIAYSNLQVSVSRTASPIIEHQKIVCDDCNNGTVRTEKGTQNCSTCSGTGFKKLHSSPFMTLERPAADYNIKDGLSQPNNYPMLNYILPPVEALRFLLELYEKAMRKAEMSVGLKQIDLIQSGIAKQYDNQEMYVMFNNISRNFYNRILITFLRTLQVTLNYQSSELPTVTASSYFDIQTEDELFTEYTDTILNDAPMFLRLRALTDYIGKKYNSDPVMMKYNAYQGIYNTLYGMSATEKKAGLFDGTISSDAYYMDFYCEKILGLINLQYGTAEFVNIGLPELNAVVQDIYINIFVPLIPPSQNPQPTTI